MQDNYHILVESITDYAIFMLDASGFIATWNIGAEKMKGYTEHEIVGSHFSILFTDEDRESNKPQKELDFARTTGRYAEEGWRMKKDGSRFRANIILNPIYSAEGVHTGFAKIIRDLTEKRRNEELYLLLVNQVKEYAIFMMDTTGHILTGNEEAERIKGYVPHEIIGKHFSLFYPVEDRAADKPAEDLTIAIRTGKYEEEGWRLRKDGSLFWASVIINPIYADSHIGFAIVTRDLTQRREMEQLNRSNIILEAANKELERFASTASHDLKEPLRKISTFSDLLLHNEKHPTDEVQRDYLKKIHTSARRMTAMIDEILNFASLSNKEQFESWGLSDIVAETVEMLEQTIHEKKAAIRYGNLPKAIVIPSQMKRLFQNLISNSLKFSKEGVAPEIYINYEYVKKQTNKLLFK